MRQPAILLVAALGLGVLGCATSHVHGALGTGPNHDDIFAAHRLDRTFPAPLHRLRVAGARVTGRGDAGDAATVYDFPAEAFDLALAEILMATGGFDSVEAGGSERVVLGDDSGAPPGLEISIDVRSPVLAFQKREQYGWGLAGWIIGLGVPTWWLHDEIYRLKFEGEAVLSDPDSGATLATVPLGDCWAEDSLNFFERNASILPYAYTLFVPPTVVPADPEAIVEALLPAAMERALGDIIAAVRGLESGDLAGRETGPDRGRDEDGGASPGAPVAVIDLPGSAAVTFDFRSPKAGDPLRGGTVDLDLDLVFPEDSRDLAQVEVNGKVVLPEEEGRPIPVKKRIPVRVRGASLGGGRITIAVTLITEMDPILARIRRSSP